MDYQMEVLAVSTIRRGVDEFALPPVLSADKRQELYQAHLQTKVHVQPCEGIDVPIEQLHPALLPAIDTPPIEELNAPVPVFDRKAAGYRLWAQCEALADMIMAP